MALGTSLPELVPAITSLVMDLPVMFAVMLLLTVPALLKGRLSRWQGVLMLCIYAAFCAAQFAM